MGCISNLVGIDATCSPTTPASGLYLSQFVSTQEVEQYLTAQHSGATALINDKFTLAEALLRAEVVQSFNKGIRQNTVVSSQRLGEIAANRPTVAPASGYWKGVEIELCPDHGWFDLYLHQVDLFTEYTGDVTVKVFDVVTGQEIASKVVACVAGENIVTDLSLTVKSNDRRLHLFIGYLTDGVTSYKVSMSGAGCGTCGPSVYKPNRYVYVNGASRDDSDPVQKNTLTSISETGGMSVTYSIQCNTLDWMCKFGNILAPAFVYKVAELIMAHAVESASSRRLNSGTINVESLKEREAKYRENCNIQMKQALGAISLPNVPPCFECNDRIRYQTRIP